MNLFNRYEKLAEKFNELDSDLERIGFLKKHKHFFTVLLGDLQTTVKFNLLPDFSEDESAQLEDIELVPFEYEFGNSDGLPTLFEALGIEAQTV